MADVQAPTTTLYHSAQYKPAADLTGGIWYDDNKEFDEGLVDVIRDVLLEHVRKKVRLALLLHLSICRSS
jgi:DNA-directed RNA polymerase III subunit RPC6